MVLADTSVWIPFFNDPGSPQKRELDRLLDAAGVALAELIQGCRTAREAEVIASRLTALPFLETTFAVWRRVGELSFGLRRRGVTLPLSASTTRSAGAASWERRSTSSRSSSSRAT